MKSTREALQRLRAFEKGKPLSRGSTRHFPIAAPKETRILAFVKMGGESAPWGIAWGRPDKDPEVFAVPEPRNRDLVADMVAEFAPRLLDHVFHPDYSSLELEGPKDPRPLRQIWLPNATHLDMLHYLAYTYTFTRFGEPKRAAILNAVGRAGGWLFREAQRPGEVFVDVATVALRESFTFPAEDVRQGHLGFLMAWLETKGGRDVRRKTAATAEARSIATALTPDTEKEVLEPLVERLDKAREKGDTIAWKSASKEIGRVITAEVTLRFELTARAYELLRVDSRRFNAACDFFVDEGVKSHWYEYLRRERQLQAGEKVFIPSPETDRHPAVAGAAYFRHDEAAAVVDALLLNDDEELQREAVAAGEAIRGKIVSVSDEGGSRRTAPVWVVETRDDVPLRIREGREVAQAGLPERKGRIRSIAVASNGKLRVELEITGLKTDRSANYARLRAATDPRLKGTTVTLLPAAVFGLTFRKIERLWKKGAPGDWLTRMPSAAPPAKLPPVAAEDLQIAEQEAETWREE